MYGFFGGRQIKFNLSPSDKNAQTNTANGSKSWITNSRLYTSREYDQELDLYYYRGRTYDARIGRFIQRDPIGYADDVNLYTYVGNNPMNYTDPWGTETKSVLKIFRNGAIDMAILNKKYREDFKLYSSKYGDTIGLSIAHYIMLRNWYYISAVTDAGFDIDGMIKGLIKEKIGIEVSLPDININIFKGQGKYDIVKGGNGGLKESLSEKYKERNKILLFDGKKDGIGELGNILIALNAYRVGMPKEELMFLGDLAARQGSMGGNGVGGENADHILHEYGYKIGELESQGKLTQEILINCINKALSARTEYVNNGTKPTSYSCE